MTKAAESSDFVRKRALYRRQSGPIRRGVGIASLLHLGGGAKIYRSDGCGTILQMDDYSHVDSHVAVLTGAPENRAGLGDGHRSVFNSNAARAAPP